VAGCISDAVSAALWERPQALNPEMELLI
jgi:hypothetical protein